MLAYRTKSNHVNVMTVKSETGLFGYEWIFFLQF